jgi:hypothetical protein
MSSFHVRLHSGFLADISKPFKDKPSSNRTLFRNICFGVWKDLDDNSVKLHHIGLMFNPDGSLSAIFTVDETDTIASDGKTYKGMFDFKLWPPSFAAVGAGTPIAEVKGTIAATASPSIDQLLARKKMLALCRVEGDCTPIPFATIPPL